MNYLKLEKKIKSDIYRKAKSVINEDILYDKFFMDSMQSGEKRYFEACENFFAKPINELFDDEIKHKLHKAVCRGSAKRVFIESLANMVNHPFSILERSKVNKFVFEVAEIFNKNCLEFDYIKSRIYDFDTRD